MALTPNQIFAAACRKAMFKSGGFPSQKEINRLGAAETERISDALAKHFRALLDYAISHIPDRSSPIGKHFESDIDEATAFYLRADWLRPMFGLWDCLDPVSHAILDLVEAQRELSDAICPELSGDCGSNAAIETAIEKREVAGEKLIEALQNRDEWPDPELGLRP